MANALRTERYICADIDVNHNKYWEITLYDDNSVTTRWGRVGETSQSKNFPHYSQDQATRFFESKCREKERGKSSSNSVYVKQKTHAGNGTAQIKVSHDLAAIATSQIQTNNAETISLVKELAKQNVHNIVSATNITYDEDSGLFKTPLGLVTQEGIDEARDLLVKMGQYVTINDYDNYDFRKSVNLYLQAIPQNIGRGRPDLRVLYPNMSSITKQNDILDSLQGALQTMLTSPPKTASGQPTDTSVPQVFDAKLFLVEDGKEIDRITKKYYATLQTRHVASSYRPNRIFAIQIGHMHNDYMAKGLSIGNIEELWHGTGVGNILSILKSGLKISPPRTAKITAQMFGNGIYFAHVSTKSLNYSVGYWGGERGGKFTYMFLFNVALGRMYTPNHYSECSSWTSAKSGYDSTFAKGGVSGVINDELIVYREFQADPVFLIEFKQ